MKKGLCFTLSVILALSLSGCWSRKEPKTLALVNSAIYDLGDTGGYEVTTEVINPAAQGGPSDSGDGKNPSITVTSQGGSLPEAIRNAAESLERRIFGGHIKARLFTERFVQKDITAILDFILRDHLADENPLMVVLRHEDPKQVYSCMLGLSESVGDYLVSMSQTQPGTTSSAVFVDTLDFVKDYYNEGKQPVCGLVRLVECESKPSNNTDTKSGSQGSQGSQDGSEKKYRIIYGGLAVFKDNKLAGYMDETEARAYNFITNNIGRSVITIASETSQTVVIVHDPKAEVKVEIQNNEVAVNLSIKTNMSIIQENTSLDISKAEALKTIEAAFNQQITEEITAAIEKAQTEFKSDIFGFGIFMHRQHPQQWETMKENWDDSFAKAPISVSVESTIDRSGEIKQPLHWEAES